MLIGMIRPVEAHSVTLKGEDLADVRAQLTAQAPEGWDLVSAMATMEKAGSMRSVEGKYLRVNGIREIEAEDMDTLQSLVPEGWQLLSVRRS
ncbi:hypothetical protein [Microbacterium sp. H6]|uniref:hypothetical protein n=1 Tax=Microbacterium sp. H6 TaxID=421122 RepID=UPI000DE4DCD5|nr:hypothetical protein [Microbacterium sp. H6]RBO73051.1 hypothetical protein DSP71_07355 [Microbacterium sp. H6]